MQLKRDKMLQIPLPSVKNVKIVINYEGRGSATIVKVIKIMVVITEIYTIVFLLVLGRLLC